MVHVSQWPSKRNSCELTVTVQEQAPVHILGAGLAGLSAAIELNDACCVVEASERPGGLVRSHCIDVPGHGRFWFDHVLHLLYFSDPVIQQKVFALAGQHLADCPPIAFVEALSGTTRYPIQMHLAALPRDVRVQCLLDLIECGRTGEGEAANLEEALLSTFGRSLCETFLFPYNRKAWGRPLHSLRGELAWTVTRPDLEKVLLGAMHDGADFTSYNAKGWYPRPPEDWPVRGMEVLSAALAAAVPRLHLRTRVTGIDTGHRRLRLSGCDGMRDEPYQACIATIPLPQLLGMVEGVPASLLEASRTLRRNRVWSVAICLSGASRQEPAHWRYYADESLCFTRLVHMAAFDPGTVPAGCAGILAEVQEPAEGASMAEDQLIARVIEDAHRAGAIDERQEVIGAKAWCVDPAYVVFEDDTASIVEAARTWLVERDIHLLGRYGRWEYSSMAQVMRDGFSLGAELKLRC